MKKKWIAGLLVVCLCANNVLPISASEIESNEEISTQTMEQVLSEENENESDIEVENFEQDEVCVSNEEVEFDNEMYEEITSTSLVSIQTQGAVGTVVKTGSCGENLTYTITVNGTNESGEDTYTLTINGYGDMDYYMDYPWEYYRDDLTKLVLSERMTNIESGAFRMCVGFTGGLNIPDSVTEIGYGAFRGCSGFTGSLNIPNSVISIRDNAFSGCSGFTGSLNIPNSVISIGSDAFYECSGFTGSLNISNSVISIGSDAFYECSGFTGSLNIPNSVICIGSDAFYECSGFTGGLHISDSVTSIEHGTFRGCSGFTGSLNIPDGVTSIGAYAFENCNGFVGNLDIPESVTSIGTGAFNGCSGFVGILNIPEGIKKIESDTFKGCSGFTGGMNIPDGVTSIGNYAFDGCSGFTGSLNIPESVTSIGTGVFKGCSGFTGDLNIPIGIIKIEQSTFSGCSGFTGSLNIPEDVTSIGAYAFSGCSGFTGSLNIPEGITKIESGTFSGCSGFTGSLNIPENITSIGPSAFKGCSGFTGSLSLPNSVTSIKDSTFSGCSGFTGNLNIPAKVTEIRYSAFRGCSGFIGNLNIPDGVTSIGSAAFNGCSGFTGSLNLPNSLTKIGSFAFENCIGFMGQLNIPNSVTSIDDGAFRGCSGFTGNLNIPERVTNLGFSVFEGCSGFTGSLKISDGVTSIGSSAFSGCRNLENVYFIGNIPNISKSALNGVTANAYYPYGNSTWTDSDLQDYGGNLTWKRWLPDGQKSVTSIAGKEEHYLSGKTKYESGDGTTETLSGDKIIKKTTWDIKGDTTIENGVLYIRSDATVTVNGSLTVEEIVIEKGGKLEIGLGGQVKATTVTAKGGWFGDSGGKLWVKQGTLITNDLNFEGQSTLLVSSGKIVVKNIMKMATGSKESTLEDGTIYIAGNMILKGDKKNFVSNSANFNVVFCGNDSGVLEASGDKFNLGMVYVTQESMFTNLNLDEGNYVGSALCRVNTSNWTFTKGKTLTATSDNVSWSTNIENAFSGIAAEHAFLSDNSQLTREEDRFVESLAAVWINTLNAPLCEGFLEVQTVQYELYFKLNGKQCVLRLVGGIHSSSSLGSVYLDVNVNDYTHTSLVGLVAKADVEEFSEKAMQYLEESMNEAFISYISGGVAGALKKSFGLDDITETMIKKFVEKISKKVCADTKILKTNDVESVKNIKNSFKVYKFVVSHSKSKSINASALYTTEINSGSTMTMQQTSNNVESQTILEVSDAVTDEWLKEELITILGEDSQGEPDFSKADEIETLDLSNGYIRDLNGLQYFTNLKELNVKNNELTDLSPLANLNKLEKLDISGQFISSLYPIAGLTSLTELDASENELVALSSVVGMTKLTNLDVSHNRIASLKEVERLTSLQELTVSNNPLNMANLEVLTGLNQLSSLNLSVCGLSNINGIPTSKLVELYLADNQIENMTSIAGAEYLRVLDISNNLISDTGFLNKITTLEKLDMSGNYLENIESLSVLEKLTELDLSCSEITDKDLESLVGLKSLKKLDVSNNLIFGTEAILLLESLEEVNITNTCIDVYDREQLKEQVELVVDNSVTPALKKIYFVNENVNLEVNEKYWQDIICYPTEIPLENVLWKSSDETIATVDEQGIITALSEGMAEITATMRDGALIATYKVNVEQDICKGDVNGDSDNTILDVQIIFAYISGITKLTDVQFQLADVNGDGKVTANDMQRIFYYLNGRLDKL